MTFFRVKPEFDQRYKNPAIHDGNIYIANELYTEAEIRRQKLNRAFMEKVQISRNKTFWSFGARFAMGA